MTTIDTSYTYLLVNGRSGPGKALSSGQNDFGKFAFMQGLDNSTSQQWFFLKTKYPNTYRMHTLDLGPAFSLDVLNSRGVDSSQVRFAATGGITGQLWTFTPAEDAGGNVTNVFRLTNDFTGIRRPLAAFQQGPVARLVNSDIGVKDAQIWTFSRLTTDSKIAQYAKETQDLDNSTPVPPPVVTATEGQAPITTAQEQPSATAEPVPPNTSPAVPASNAPAPPATTRAVESAPPPPPGGVVGNLGFPAPAATQTLSPSFPNLSPGGQGEEPGVNPDAVDPSLEQSQPDGLSESPVDALPEPSAPTLLPAAATEGGLDPTGVVEGFTDGTPPGPSSQPNLSPSASPTASGSGMSSGAIAGVVIGLLILAGLCAAAFLFRRSYKKRRAEEEEGVPWTLVSRPSSGPSNDNNVAGLEDVERMEIRERIMRFLGIHRASITQGPQSWDNLTGSRRTSRVVALESEEVVRTGLVTNEKMTEGENPFRDPSRPGTAVNTSPPGTAVTAGPRPGSSERTGGVLVIRSVGK